MEDGGHICVQLLDRPQKLLKVVVIALDSFTSDRDKAPLPYVLWEEHTEIWINVSSITTIVYHSLLIKGPWVVHLTLGSNRGVGQHSSYQ